MTEPDLAPMQYTELYALAGARLPPAWSYGVDVRTWTWRDMGDSPRTETEWNVCWFEPLPGGKHKVHSVRGATARAALQRLYEAVPQHDATGVGDQVGDGSVGPNREGNV